MKQFSPRVILGCGLFAVHLALATDEIFINVGDLTYAPGEAPQIDAKAFYNSGNFLVYSAPLAYDFQNVLSFTNRGVMRGSIGFAFDLATSTSKRIPSENFVNQRGGLIEGVEGYGFVASNTLYYPTFVTVSATNIVNEGVLAVGNSGLLRLEGKKINLTRGGFEVGSIQPDPNAGYLPGTYYYWPEPGIYDGWWGMGSEPTNGIPGQDSGNIARPSGGGAGFTAVSPQHWVSDNYGAGYVRVGTIATYFTGFTNVAGATFLTITNQDGTTTNFFAPTNLIRQAVFVGVSDTNNFTASARFYPSTIANVAHHTVAIQVQLANTNVVGANSEVDSLYFVDRLASETNLIFATNYLTYSLAAIPTYRPASHEIWRAQPFEFAFGRNGNAVVDQNFVYDRAFSNRFVTNYYAGTSAYADYLTVRPPLVPGLGPLDQPGRIEIVGDEVDLTKARFRGMGVVSVDAKHLISSSNTLVDAPNLLYNLGSTNGLLTIQNLAKQGSVRMAGYLDAWSGLWTNQMAVVYSNWFIDPTTNYYSPITNPLDIGIHVVILSASLLDATQRVVVHDLVARATNIVVNDPIIVDRKLMLEGSSFTLNGTLSLTNLDTTNGLPNWYATNMPGMQFFTNNGVLTVPSIANLGSDSEVPLQAFVNEGTLNAFTANIVAETYVDGGSVNLRNNLTVVTTAGQLDGGRDVVRGQINLVARDLKLRNHSITADRGIFLQVTNSLSDAGAGSPNTIQVADGFHLLAKPAVGDLFGTTFQTTAAKFASPLHTWAAEDRGVSTEGFKDNVALGRLVLDVFPGGELRFGGPVDYLGNPLPGEYGLYVDYLQLQASVQADPEAVMYIYPGLVIYFANANVNPEELDGKFEGRLRWVSHYAGPTSGTPVASRQSGYEIKTITVNTALLNSTTIDSDGDGLANAYDTWPFDGVTLKDVRLLGTPATELQLAWDGAPETVYRVEKALALVPPSWTTLQTITNTATSVQTLTVTDSLSGAAEPERFYRVRYDP